MAGRPPIKIDEEKLKLLAQIGCTQEEMAAALGCSVDTLKRNFAEPIKTGGLLFKVSVRREQMRLLKAGNATMGVWLGKQVLGQRDQLKIGGDDEGTPIRVNALREIPTKDLESLAAKLAAALPKRAEDED
jgi:hypothetical protein